MSGLRSYILDEDPESPATLHSSPPPPSRRHQQQQQQQQASNASRTTAASTAYPRLRALYLHSDADASSDFSELELHRPVPSSSGGEGGLGDFSDYETPLPGRWDLAAHWHMGEYYSEGVEGDADDDDDEDRDLDTDLSEGPTPGPGLRAGRWTGGSDRGRQLDMGRVRDILASPISASNAFNNTGLSNRTTTSDTVTTAGPSASTGTGAGGGGGGSMFSSNLIGSMADIDSFSSSTSEDIISSHHHHQHRAYQPHINASERSVRFSRDAAPPTRAFQTPQLTADINASTPALEPMTPEIFTPVSDSTIGTNTHDVDDIMQSTQSLTEIFSGTSGSLNQYRPSTRPQAQASSSTGQDSSPGGGFDHSGHSRVYSPSRPTDFTGQGSSRTQFVRYPLPPGGGNGQSRLAGGSGGGNGSLQQPQHHHLFTLAALNRHGLVSSPRGHLSPYWGALERSRRHGSQSPRYSSTSPNSSTSSSRIGSPVLDPQSAVLKSQDTEDGESGLMMTEQQDEGHRLNQPATCNIPLTDAREGAASRQASGMSQGIGFSRQQQGASRQGSSILATNNEQKITSLPSFASSVFMPVIQGTTLIPCAAYGPSGLYRRPKSNHPRRPCCFLQAGQKFSGSQSLKTMTSTLSGMRARQVEEWNVKVVRVDSIFIPFLVNETRNYYYFMLTQMLSL